MSFKFTKMHGAGNDYIYVNCFETIIKDPAAVAVKVSNRNFGIGGDGLVLVLPPDVDDADVRMRMFNSDGSESEMCGNAIRCVAKFSHERKIAPMNPVRVQTGDGIKIINKIIDDSGEVVSIRVAMGEPRVKPEEIPVLLHSPESVAQVVNMPVEANLELDLSEAWVAKSGLESKFSCVSMGNPHIVMFCNSVDSIPLEQVGPLLEIDPAFPKKINVHFVEVISESELKMRTWERGSGVTLACGTGASAVCVAGVLAGKSGRDVMIHLPGGDLQIQWSDVDNGVFMTGGAVEVYNGQLLCEV